MKKNLTFLIITTLLISCNNNLIKKWENYDESNEIKVNSENENKRLQFKRIQSISKDKNQLINGFEKEIFNFLKNEYDFVKLSLEDYDSLDEKNLLNQLNDKREIIYKKTLNEMTKITNNKKY